MSSDDIEAIKQLKARYFRYMDTKEWERLEHEVFAPDVHIDMENEGGGVHADIAARARPVFRHDVPAGVGRHLDGGLAGQDVGAAAGREGHDQADGFGGNAWARQRPLARARARPSCASRSPGR